MLETCLETKTPYMDICDDSDYSRKVKAQHEAAVAAGVPAITTAGIYPGVSNVMAAHMISSARKEYDKDGNYVGRDGGPPCARAWRIISLLAATACAHMPLPACKPDRQYYEAMIPITDHPTPAKPIMCTPPRRLG